MLRHFDIRLVVLLLLGGAAFGLVILLRNFGLNNVPDENVVYVNTAVGDTEGDDAPPGDNTPTEPPQEDENLEANAVNLSNE